MPVISSISIVKKNPNIAKRPFQFSADVVKPQVQINRLVPFCIFLSPKIKKILKNYKKYNLSNLSYTEDIILRIIDKYMKF